MSIADPRNRNDFRDKRKGPVPIPLHVGAPGNGKMSLFGVVSASLRLRVRGRCLVFVCPIMM